jgi:hypothetical protein
MSKTACLKYNTKYNMNEQYKTTEEIDKALKQKKELLAQKEAELNILNIKKESARNFSKDSTDPVILTEAEIDIEVDKLEQDLQKYILSWKQEREELVKLYEQLLKDGDVLPKKENN